MARDSQRSQLYAAEAKLKTGLDPGFRTTYAIGNFIDEMIATRWWQERYPEVTYIKVKDGRGRRSACASRSGRYIKLPLWARNKHVILHEVAHVVTRGDVPAHGREYAKNYHDLLLKFAGPEAADLFLAGCIEYRVKIGSRRPGFKLAQHTADDIILKTGVEKLPVWASEGTVFWGCTVWGNDPDGPMFDTGEIRYFPGIRNAQRWSKTRAKTIDGGEVRIEKHFWHEHEGWTPDPDNTFDYYAPKIREFA